MIASEATSEREASGCQKRIWSATKGSDGSERGNGVFANDEGIEATELVFVLSNDQARIAPVVEFLATEATRLAVCDAMEQMRISLALEEALVNALYHGNLEINSDGAGTEQFCRYDLAEQRRSQQPYCNRRIRVFARMEQLTAVFVIRDEGHGFDPQRLLDPTDEENLERTCGRGVFLMRSLMDKVTYNEIGNEVTLVRRWSR
jgi:anti-sigma regulatory factor (Ser/Thr protein kinase)